MIMILFCLLVILFSSSSDALTCRNYDNNKCVSVGCDVHCTGLGKKGGYCSFGGSYCTCNCISSNGKLSSPANSTISVLQSEPLSNDLELKYADAVDSVVKENYATLFKSDQSCECMFAGSCFSCGAQANSMVCVKGCGWRVCLTENCVTNACFPHACK